MGLLTVTAILFLCAWAEPAHGVMSAYDTITCWANATQCMSSLFSKLGFTVDPSVSLEQTANISKGVLVRPWSETCTGDYGSAYSPSFNCYKVDLYKCEEGLQANLGVSSALFVQTYALFEYYCATGCEQIQQIMKTTSNCWKPFEKMRDSAKGASLTSENKTALCNQARTSITCADQSKASCQFAAENLKLSVNVSQSELGGLNITAQDCLLSVPSPTTPLSMPSPTTTTSDGKGTKTEGVFVLLLMAMALALLSWI